MLDPDRRSESAPTTTKAPASRLARGHTVDEAIGLILENCLYQVTANRAAAEDGREPEGVHQMRVGLRRLRAALQLLRKALPRAGFEAFESEAKALADALGPARNLDALDGRVARLAGDGTIGHADCRTLREAIAAWRTDLQPDLRTALRSQRSDALLEGLAAWIAERGWRSRLPERKLGLLAKPARRLARRALDRLDRKARKRGRHFAGLSAQRRHKFRIATKKLRYAVKLLGPLFGLTSEGARSKEGRGARRYQLRLGKLQDALGEDHDAVVTPGLLDAIAARADPTTIAPAIDALLAGQERRRPALRKDLRKRRRRWQRAKVFW